VVVCAVAGLMLARPAEANKRNFAWTYDWFTPYQGEKELELWLTRRDDDTVFQVEYEFAVNERYAMGLYAVFGGADSESFDFKGWKWEQRYRFGDYAPGKFLHAAYLELAKERGEPYELEGKWIVSRYRKDDSAFSFNLIAERPLESGAVIEWGYAMGCSRPVGSGWRLGLESKGSFTEAEYFLGPTATYDVTANLRIIGGVVAGLTAASDDLQARVITEYEWF